MNRLHKSLIVATAAAWVLLVAAMSFAQAPQRLTGAPQAQSVVIVIVRPDGTQWILRGSEGIYKIITAVQTFDAETLEFATQKTSRTIEIGCNIEPAPPIPDDEEVVPPFPSGPRFILIISEKDRNKTPLNNLLIAVKPTLIKNGHSYRWIDDQAETGAGTVPAEYARHLKSANKTPGPDMWILTQDGKEVYSGGVPVDADKFLDILRKSGGAVK